jgi:tetratricopeptide (TPR) repeat protein
LGRSDAEDALREAMNVEEAVVNEAPGVPEYRADLANHADSLAGLYRMKGELAEAELLYRRAVAEAAVATQDRPQTAEFTQLELSHRQNLASCLAQLGRPEALPAARAVATASRDFAVRFPNHPLSSLQVAGAQVLLGRLLVERGQPAEGFAELELALNAALPGEHHIRAQALTYRAEALVAMGRYDQAAADCAAARAIGNGRRTNLLAFHEACCDARRGKPVSAAQVIQGMGEGAPSRLLPSAARVFCLAAAAETAGSEAFCQQAESLLQKVAQAGPNAVLADALEFDADFAILRTRTTFPELVKSLRPADAAPLPALP